MTSVTLPISMMILRLKVFRDRYPLLKVWLTAVILFMNCNANPTDNNILIYKVKKIDFINKATANGVIEAKKGVTITCPEIWPQPMINKLALEGVSVQKDEIVCSLEAGEVTNNYEKALNDLETSKADYKKTEADLRLQRALLQSRVKNVEAAVAIARLQMPQLEYVSPLRKKMIELQLQRSDVEKMKIDRKLVSLEVVQKTELDRMKLKIKQAENSVARAKMYLDRLTLTAPSAGIVVYEINWMTDEKVKEGDRLFPGMPIIRIPETSVLQAMLQADETMIKKIKKDQLAHIRIDAMPGTPYTGKVTQVASVGKPIKEGSKIKKFEVIAELDSTNLKIQPGLTTTCEIVIESIPDTIIIPIECVFEKDSVKFVYVRKKSKFHPKPVTTGISSENFVLITSGLRVDEELALTTPPDRQVEGQ